MIQLTQSKQTVLVFVVININNTDSADSSENMNSDQSAVDKKAGRFPAAAS